MFWDVSIVEISKLFIMEIWGANIVEKSTTVNNVCRIHRQWKKNYEVLFKGSFSQARPKTSKMI